MARDMARFGTTVRKALRASVDWISRSPRRAVLLVFLLSLAVRGALLGSWLTPRDWVLPEADSELGAVAQELARTGQYANPYSVPTGPTAHPLPINTGLLGLLYRLLGITWASGYVRCLVGIASYSAMYAMLPWLAGKFGAGRQAGLLSGLAGALLPDQGPGEFIGWTWSEPLAAIALSLLLVAVQRRWLRHAATASGSLLLGVGFGVAFHLAPALLPVMLGCMVFELWWRRDRRKWSDAAMMALGAVLTCVPWAWRNYETFHEVFFIRSNLGLELRVGNHEGAVADIDVMDAREGSTMRHPRNNAEEARLVPALGEMDYMRQARREALEWIRTHPAEFARLTASRAMHLWCGSLHRPASVIWVSTLTLLAILGAWRVLPQLTVPRRAALLIPLATYPLIYYVVVYMSRYRVPLNWILLILAGAAVWRWLKRPRRWPRGTIARPSVDHGAPRGTLSAAE